VSKFEAFGSLEAIEPFWRDLEARADASPFQRFAFTASYVPALSAPNGAEPAFILIHGSGGAAEAILPLEKVRRSGVTILRSIGGKHASYHLALASREGAKLLAADPAGALRQAAEAAGGTDLIMLTSQPLCWEGAPNPLALPGSAEAASHAYETALPGAAANPTEDARSFIEAHLSSDTRKKLRKKRQALAKLGQVSFARPLEPNEIETTLQAFFAQKERRFAAQGIANPFAEPTVQAFLRAACLPRGGPPAIELHTLRSGDKIVAVFGLAVGFSRASGMFTSFEDDPAIARCSPGDLLLNDIVRDLIERGFRHFDLGVGEARYKNSFCTSEVRLVNSFLPLTLHGRLAAAALQTASWVKTVVKRDRRLLSAANTLRSAARRFG
jgi:CelD/BcsL family acetyltransferase involved in cellulose biosynthesis